MQKFEFPYILWTISPIKRLAQSRALSMKFLAFCLLLLTVSAWKSPLRPNRPTYLFSAVTNQQSLSPTNENYLTIIKSSIAKLRQARDKSEGVEPMSVIEALISLERTLPKQNKVDEGHTDAELLKNLKGAWRLVFTTGTVDFQKKIGKINYFPVKAVQSFDTDNWRITNGIYLGTFPVLKFFGEFSWQPKMKKLEFDFDQISVLGLTFSLPKPDSKKPRKGAARPFFKWIHADEEIATARGGSGGLALWRRDDEMSALLLSS